MEELLRFLIGGIAVSAFAALSDIFSPKSFAGLFGAAPSIALATLALTVTHSGKSYAAVEGRSMLLGAVAFCGYAALCSRVLMRGRHSALAVTVTAIPVWFAVSLLLLWLMQGAAA